MESKRNVLALCVLILIAPLAFSAQDHEIYSDALASGWEDWGWGTHSLTNTSPVHAGTYSISMVPDNWDGTYLHYNGGLSGTAYDGFEFFVHGGTSGGQILHVIFWLDGTTVATVLLSDYLPGGPVAGSWSAVRIPFDDCGLGTASFNEIVFQAGTSSLQPTVYFDDLKLTTRSGEPPSGDPVSAAISPELDRRPIDPLIYGASTLDVVPAGTLHYPLRRWGGNWTTTYNWETDTRNVGMDWYWISYTDDEASCGTRSDCVVNDCLERGEAPLISIPMIGWTPKDSVRRWSFSVAKYGAQQETECTQGDPSWCNPDAGNGVLPSGTPLTGNDPTDCYAPVTSSFAGNWLTHLVSTFGAAASGGVSFYALDNEPMLWNSTHRDVHPTPVDYDEIWGRTLDYASVLKAGDPGAKIFGPVVWGWCAYFYSAADGCGPGEDHAAHGDFLPWYLDQVEAYRQAHGVRLVDYLDIHYYPQSGNVYSSDESAGTSALRLRSLKSLYDPSYSDESWIGQPVNLIPRMRSWIDAHAPGTKLAITEYNFGDADNGISSALAQAEALAIFGREGVDAANRWVVPDTDSLVEDAFRLYLNYDGAGANVTGESVRAVSSNRDAVGTYAVRGPEGSGLLYVLLFNKDTSTRSTTVSVAGGLVGSVSVYGFDSGSRLSAMGSLSQSAGAFTVEMPARSARLAVSRMCLTAPPAVPEMHVGKDDGGSQINWTWTDVTGAVDYGVVEDTLANGSFTTITGTAATGVTGLTAAMPSGVKFYKVFARNPCGNGSAG